MASRLCDAVAPMMPSSFLPDLLDHHVETAAFLWSLRAHVSRSRTHTLDDLTRIDERLEANLDALVLAAADDAPLPTVAGGRFVTAFVATRAALHGALAAALLAADEDPAAEEELGAALGRAPAAEARGALQDAIAVAPATERERVERSARRCLWRAERWHRLTDERAQADPLFAAALMLERAARGADPSVVEAMLRDAASRGQERKVIEAAAAWGDPRVVPWLLTHLATPALARHAGWAVSTIVGVDLAAAGLAGAPPAGFCAGPSDSPLERDVGVDPDARLPWPDAPRLRAWWAEHASRHPPGTPLLRGAPRDEASLARALRDGTQWVRHLAAFHLRHVVEPSRGAHFPVDAPAFRQACALGARSAGHVAGR